MKEPWKPDTKGTGSVEESYMQLLPLMDLVLTQGMNLAELEKHIDGRLAKLKLLPGKQKLEQNVFLWREKQKEMIEAGEVGIPNSDNLPVLLVKMMLAIEKAEITIGDGKGLPLTKEITASLAKTKFESRVSILKHVYNFFVNRRMEITLATRELISPKFSVNGKIVNGNGSGGKGSGGEGAPPAASSGGGSAPPADSTPSSSSHGFKGIARSSAESVYDAQAQQPWATDAEALHVESGMEFMAGMGTTALAATAAKASMSAAF
jgi:hypothetical protein